MQIYQVTDPEFREYGRIIKGIDFAPLLEGLEKTPCPDDVIYVAGDPELEKLPICEEIQRVVYGELPVQIGYCNGHNHKLTGVSQKFRGQRRIDGFLSDPGAPGGCDRRIYI